MGFKLTSEQLASLNSVKLPQESKPKSEKDLIQVGLTRNKKPYLSFGKCAYYKHQVKGIIALLKDKRFSGVKELENYLTLMLKAELGFDA